ncbi:MAG TPA: SdpI family protein, partial [Gemmatales bacterium]|nr:SdpI family protein [Gemmatales bacterium]
MNRLYYLGSLLLIAASFGLSSLVYMQRNHWLPEQVPVHWGVDFEPDRWVARDEIFWTLFLFPCIMLGMMGLIYALLRWLSPKGYDATKANPQLSGYVILLMTGLFAALHAVILLGYMNFKLPIEAGIMGVIFLFFILIGNILGKVQQNFWIGIRTPWTLTNHKVWEKTHRLAAWLFVGSGLLGLLSLPLLFIAPKPLLLICWVS